MKKAILALAAVWLLASPMWGAEGGIGVFGAWWDPDDVEDDIGGGAILRFELGNKVDIELRGTLFPEFQRVIADPGGTEESLIFEFETTALEIGVAYNFVAKGAVIPYIGGGFGYYLFDVKSPPFTRAACWVASCYGSRT